MNYSKVLRIKKCRLCGTKKFTKLFSLGNLFISTFVKNKKDHIGKAPLELIWCDNCTLVQLRHSAPQELLYSGNYWYQSHLNSVIINDLKEIVSQAMKMAKVKRGEFWLDIGANDGTLLGYVPENVIRYGIEPAKNLQQSLKRKCDVVIKDMWENVELGSRFKVITAIGMFYDSEDPNLFVANVRKHLTNDGLFIAQMMTAKSMLEKNDVGNICHEHLEYYSYKSLKYLFEKNGLEIFKVEENSINGGSYRLFARHYQSGSIAYPENITRQSYLDFYKRIKKNKKDCLDFLRTVVKARAKVYGYGASTKFNTIAQWYGLSSRYLRGIAEIHPQKLGRFTVGTAIPIIKEDKAKKDADYFLVGPYAFKKSFINREAQWLKDGGRFVFTTPSFEIYGK